jgi:hypothetical protein
MGRMVAVSGPFAPLLAELDRWAAAGRVAAFWWRDDDAVAATPALDRLRATTAGIPVGLAVVPAGADGTLARAVDRWHEVEILCHGEAHRNWSPPERKTCELGPDRPAAVVLDGIGAGRERLAGLFGVRLLPVLVPPWNRIDPALVPALPGRGWRGLSTFGDRRTRSPAPGLVAVNTHVDIMDWSARSGRPAPDVVRTVVERLAARRPEAGDPAEPVGILSHHLVHDDAAWDSCAGLAAVVTAHPAARWVRPSMAFEGG